MRGGKRRDFRVINMVFCRLLFLGCLIYEYFIILEIRNNIVKDINNNNEFKNEKRDFSVCLYNYLDEKRKIILFGYVVL